MTSYLNKYSPFTQLVIFIGLYLGCTVIFYLLAMGWILPHFFHLSAMDLQTGAFSDPHVVHVMKLFQLGYSIFSFLIPSLLFFYLWHSEPFRYAGLKSKFQWSWALAGVVILFFSLPTVGSLADLNQNIHFGPFDQSLRALQQEAQDATKAMLKMQDAGSFIFNMILIAVIPAIAEECFFRGVIQRLLVKITHKAWIGIGIAAIIFSLLHGEMLGFFPRVFLGLVLGYIYYISGNLWYSIIAHFVNNGFQVVLVYLFQQKFITTDISQNTPTPLAFGIIGLVIVVVMLLMYQKYIPENPDKKLWTTKNHLMY